MKRDLPKYVYRRGQYKHLYFTTALSGGYIRLPDDPNSPEFFAKYAECLAGNVETTGRHTLDNVIKSYWASEKTKNLAANTLRKYRKYCDDISKNTGSTLVKSFKTPDINAILKNNFSDRPTAGNKMLAMFAILFQHAISLGWITVNPAAGADKLKEKKQSPEPWTDAEIERFNLAANDRESLVCELAHNTGQRIGDILNMKWSDLHFDEDTQTWGWQLEAQQKTGTGLYIPFTQRLQEMLKRLHNSLDQGNVYVVVNQTRPKDPLSYDAFSVCYHAALKKAKLEGKKIHGWRHTCAQRLANMGMTDEQIMSITGHNSKQMVQHYCKMVAQKRRAKDVINALNAAQLAAE